MASTSNSNGATASTPQPAAAASSCRKKKSEGVSFVQDVRDHIDEFLNASMDEHVTCFKKTFDKLFKTSQTIAKDPSPAPAPVESVLPLESTTSSS
ncbi:hypothetical protein GOP47_0023833 [Adiantum capillus-veneris]|uniref:Uncharacterized protein n=1 Tax=Adiantum capillus-veneris TaxID=13818 RepID=A0A9D4Z3Q6_ADICA|nr:hypothetical protein GOP47_0023833 [Adiantum capillus-veneris]